MILRNQDSLSRFPIPPSSLQLFYTLKCGQVFRWRNLGGGYAGFLDNFPIHALQHEERIDVIGDLDVESTFRSYFRLDDPLEVIAASWRNDPVLLRAAKAFQGLRLIRQDPWACLVGFVLSIVSNIPKIETSLEKLAQHAGNRVMLQNTALYSLPSPETLYSLREKTLRSFGIGFRARYLRECARIITQGFPFESLADRPYLEARQALMEFPGIGEKVADCVLLHGFGHLEAFPVDVWMKRILERYYFRGKQKTERYLSEWGRDKFGPWAGYAELYLYTFGRRELDPQSPFRG